MAQPEPADFRAEILKEVSDPNGTVNAALTTIWNLNAEKGAINPELQVLYTKRAALDIRLGEEQASIDFTVGKDVQDMQSQRFEHLQKMRDDCQEEIVRVEALTRARRAPVTGALKTTESWTVPADQTDPTDMIGSPFVRGPVW